MEGGTHHGQKRAGAAEPLGSMEVGDHLGEGVHSPGFGHKRNVGRHVLRPDIAGGEHDPQIRPQTLGSLGQFGSAHAGHAHIREQDLDLRAGLEELQCAMAVVGRASRSCNAPWPL